VLSLDQTHVLQKEELSYLRIMQQFNFFDYFPDDLLLRGKSEIGALNTLERPTLFRVKGHDSSKAVLISSLIHGHEICGFRAVLNEINKAKCYRYDIYFLVGNVSASKLEPHFSFRNVPGGQNFNRVWTCREPQTLEELAAKEMKHFIETLPLIGFLDLHSFTGRSMAPHTFISSLDEKTKSIASVLTEFVMLFDEDMGMTIHAMKSFAPSFIVECGTNGTRKADLFAIETLKKFLIEMNYETGVNPVQNDRVHTHVMNIKVRPDRKIVWSDREQKSCDLTIREDIESLNLKDTGGKVWFGWGRDLSGFMIKKQGAFIDPSTVFEVQGGNRVFISHSVFPTLLSTQERITKESGFYFFNHSEGF